MATIAQRRPAWSLPASVASARLFAPLAIAGLMALSVLLRTQDFGVGFWIDEGLSVGIADRPLSDIPAALRLDGSPPLYYALLHVWMSVFGSTEEATHALSLVCAVLAVPAAWWAARGLFGETAGLIAALLAATNPFLTHYAQETRMYALVALLGVLACGTFGRAYVLAGTDLALPRAARRRWAAAFAVALAALLYTHNWSLFFAAGCGVTWLALLAAARGETRRELFLDGLVGFGGAVLLFSPWLPTLAFQVQHTGAPWSASPGLDDLLEVPAPAARDGRAARPAAGGGRRRGGPARPPRGRPARRAAARCWRSAGSSWRRCSSPTRPPRSRRRGRRATSRSRCRRCCW